MASNTEHVLYVLPYGNTYKIVNIGTVNSHEIALSLKGTIVDFGCNKGMYRIIDIIYSCQRLKFYPQGGTTNCYIAIVNRYGKKQEYWKLLSEISGQGVYLDESKIDDFK